MTTPSQVRIATLNVNGLPTYYHIKGADEVLMPHQLRHKAICRWFEQSDIDIINFQEVFTYRNLRLLKHHLPSHPYAAYQPFLFGPKGALVIFSKFPLSVGHYSSFLPSATEISHSKVPKSNIVRSALKGILTARLDQLPLTLINTHLLFNGWDLTKAHRFDTVHKAQLDQLTGEVKDQRRKSPGTQIVVSGDLNIEVGELSNDFLRQSRLYDLFEGDDSPSFHNEFLADLKTTARIDFLMTSDKASVPAADPKRILAERFQLKGRQVYLSDHQGLAASITLPT